MDGWEHEDLNQNREHGSVEYCLYSLRVLSKGSLLWGKKGVSELFSENSASLRHIFSDFCGQIWWRLQNMPECVMPAMYRWNGLGRVWGFVWIAGIPVCSR